ncbi:unknown [Collinsella sp. CAG:289]|nr:unknown [Collinsella sp. CAG:289]
MKLLLIVKDRRRDVWVTKAIRGNLMKKVYTIFIKKEECYDRSRGHR